MTYCIAIAVDEGLLFASDSRTNAGPDQVSTYSKMHRFGEEGDRQLVLLSAGNLATTQSVVSRVRRDIADADGGGAVGGPTLLNVASVEEAAEYVGGILREQASRHAAVAEQTGFNPEATFIVGGQVSRDEPAELYLVYPAGNYITTSTQTPFLQLGEVKYGKAILDRIIKATTTLDEAARCALVSLDSTMRWNTTVGPPVELMRYERDSLRCSGYRSLGADDPYLVAIGREWGDKLQRAFDELPEVNWASPTA